MVTKADNHDLGDWTFVAAAEEAIAAAQDADWLSLTQSASVQLQGLPIFVKQDSIVVESRQVGQSVGYEHVPLARYLRSCGLQDSMVAEG
jgi:hypothetical protein